MKKSRGQQEAEAVLDYLHSRGVERFVHFTSLDNVKSILEYGIAPRSILDARNLPYHWNDCLRLDGSKHVNLSITHPNISLFYKFRKSNPSRYYVVLSIRLEVLLEYTGDGGRGRYEFTSTNAASCNATSCNVEQLFSGQRPEGYRDEWTTDPQAEVLIPGVIDPRYIDAILLPSNYKDDGARLRAIQEIDEFIASGGLDCKLQVHDIIFDDLRERMLRASPQEKFEHYFLSWQTTEEDYLFLESEIEKMPSTSYFDSITVPMDSLPRYVNYYSDPAKRLGWSLKFHKSIKRFERTLEELAALAVIEKILNRSVVGVLSGNLEGFLYNAVFGRDAARLNDESWVRTYRDLVSQAHQIQCALVELAKHQRIGKSAKVRFVRNGEENNNLSIVACASLQDLTELSQSVSELYGCDNPFEAVECVKDDEASDFTINYDADGVPESLQEACLSAYGPSTTACCYDPIQIQSPVALNPTPANLTALLKYIFRFDSFREGQYPALARALNREDTIVLLPTGSGKSVIFQLLSLITPGTAFIVSPITSLIDDQVQNLEARGIDRVVGLTGKTKDKKAVERGLATGQYLMCYVSPERFQIQSFINSVRNYARENLVSAIAIDEAHCVSEWGHDFRTSYLGLARNCREVCSTKGEVPPLLALTGTASISVLMDMKHDLGIESPNAIVKPRSFDRPEIHYRVVRAPSEGKLDALGTIIRDRLPQDLGISQQRLYEPTGAEDTMAGIVFCQNVNGSYGLMNSQKALEHNHLGVWDYMDSILPGRCSYYCGEKPKRLGVKNWDKEKQAQALSFKKNNSSVMVATKAFGMGIDKPNVRWVVHFGMPSSLESYYQEVGRAARDKNDSYAYLILSDDYPDLNDAMLDPTGSNLAKVGELEEKKERFKGDDVSRCLYFHQSTFEGIEEEMRTAYGVFAQCGRANYHDKRWHIPFGGGGKNAVERAVYRLTLLGAFKGYTVEYYGRGDGEFIIESVQASGSELRKIVADNYISYIRAYQSDAAFLDASRRSLESAVAGVANDRDYILHVLRHLLTNFTYKVIEEGRRRAIMTILDAMRKASEIRDVAKAEEYLRSQIVAYLTTGDDGEEEIGLRAVLYDATDIEKLIAIIEQAVLSQEQQAVSQQVLRLLEDYPQHYGFYYIMAALQATSGDDAGALQSARSMIHFGTENYGLSVQDCVENFLVFLEGSASSEIDLASLDKIVHYFASLLDVPAESVFARMRCGRAKDILRIYELNEVAKTISGGMKWNK